MSTRRNLFDTFICALFLFLYSNGASGSWFCCNNHEEKNGACVECEIGYVAKDGYLCQPCSYGLWGRRCIDLCSCKHNERCDIGYGCVDSKPVMPEKLESTSPKESTHVATTAERISLEREFIIYSLSAGSIAVLVALSAGCITVIITLATCCLKFKRKADRLYKLQSRRTQHDQVPLELENVESNIEGTYDLIDEETMIVAETLIGSVTRAEGKDQGGSRHSATVNQKRSSSSNSEGDISNSSSEGYLNPYQPVIEVDVHDYGTLAYKTTKSEEISSGNSGSSICSSVQAYR